MRATQRRYVPALLLTVASAPNPPPGRALIHMCGMDTSTASPVTALGSGWICACTSIRTCASGQGCCCPWARQALGQWILLQAWPYQADAQILDHEGAFQPWHLLAANTKETSFLPSSGHLETSRFCNCFHKNGLPATVELLATGLIGSLYLLSSNGPRGDSCSGAGLRACSCSQGCL